MPLKKGNTNIGAIYKGTTQIAKIYKGTTLLFENAKWLDYLFEHIYHSLIPTTIDSKTVQDKAKLTKISGNGVVENQLVNTTDTSITLGTHKYLTYINGTWSIITGTSQIISVSGGTDMLIDLTLMFGTGNEPTDISDNRIQALLNRGYIAYNTGSYKNSRVGEIECEPYNLFDGEIESGSISDTGVLSPSSNACRSVNHIEVQSGKEYSVSNALNLSIYIVEYNADYNFISRTLTTTTKILTSNTRYVKLCFYKTDSGIGTNIPTKEQLQGCFHITGTRTGYAPYQAPSKITLPGLLELNGAINSHDTFEITNTGYVFTRNVGKVDLGSLSWSYPDNSFSAKLVHNNNGASRVSNMCCDKYITRINGSSYDIDKALFSANNSYIRIRDDSYNGDYSSFATAMSGTYLYYELATPQVITIPKKHLGCVDLGTLGLSLSGGYWRATITNIKIPVTTSTQANIYCNVYLNDSYSHLQSQGYMAVSDSGMLYIKDSTKKQASDFSGIYLFYETDAEVSDFDNIAQINAGGSITSDSEVLPNVNFEIKCK